MIVRRHSAGLSQLPDGVFPYRRESESLAGQAFLSKRAESDQSISRIHYEQSARKLFSPQILISNAFEHSFTLMVQECESKNASRRLFFEPDRQEADGQAERPRAPDDRVVHYG